MLFRSEYGLTILAAFDLAPEKALLSSFSNKVYDLSELPAFCKKHKVEIGIVTVPDKRLDVLAEMYNPEKYTPAVIEFVDIAGLVRGASKGEGLGNKFLSHIRETDAIVHVVRCFEDDNIIHVDGNIDPLRDVETINLELIFSDLELIERRIDRTKKAMKGDKSLAAEVELLERLKETLEAGKCARTFEMTEDERAMLADTPLLTMKPVIYVANIAEGDIGTDLTQIGRAHV